MDLTIRQTTSDLEAQWTASNYAFRKRINELEQAKKELEWQKKNVRILASTCILYRRYIHLLCNADRKRNCRCHSRDSEA